MSVTTATQLEPASAISESALSTLKVTSSASLATQPKSLAKAATKVLDVPKRDHPPKRTATLKVDATQPAPKKAATVAKPKTVKTAKGSELSYGAMIADAIEKLAEKKGSSAVAILKYIANHHAVGDFATARRFINKALKRGVERGTIVTSTENKSLSGRFRLVKKPKVEKKPKTAASGDGAAKTVKPKKTSSTKKTSAQKTAKKSTAASKKAPTPKKAKPSAKSTKTAVAAKKSTAPKSSTKKTATAKTTKPSVKKAATSKKTTSKAVVKAAKKPTAVKSATKKAIAAK